MTKPANISRKQMDVIQGLGDDPKAWWVQAHDENGPYTEVGPFSTVAAAIKAAREEARNMGWTIASADKVWLVGNEAFLSVDE